MDDALAVAIPTCSARLEDIRIGYVLEALALQPPSLYCDCLQVYIWDEGAVPITADRWVQLALDFNKVAKVSKKKSKINSSH